MTREMATRYHRAIETVTDAEILQLVVRYCFLPDGEEIFEPGEVVLIESSVLFVI